MPDISCVPPKPDVEYSPPKYTYEYSLVFKAPRNNVRSIEIGKPLAKVFFKRRIHTEQHVDARRRMRMCYFPLLSKDSYEVLGLRTDIIKNWLLIKRKYNLGWYPSILDMAMEQLRMTIANKWLTIITNEHPNLAKWLCEKRSLFMALLEGEISPEDVINIYKRQQNDTSYWNTGVMSD